MRHQVLDKSRRKRMPIIEEINYAILNNNYTKLFGFAHNKL